uniref:Uncharacterized protein n=1 Tax=Lepeophtheirus salmonis TaxID=72036 RepID=A0A0K2U8F2_LEPSM
MIYFILIMFLNLHKNLLYYIRQYRARATYTFASLLVLLLNAGISIFHAHIHRFFVFQKLNCLAFCGHFDKV